jgi:hypothetical protein
MTNSIQAPTAQPGIVTEVETWFSNFISSAESFFRSRAWPFVKTLFLSLVESELAMIEPLAVQAAGEVEKELGLMFGSPGDFIRFFDAVVAALWQKVQADGLAIAENTILTAAQAAIANLIASKT